MTKKKANDHIFVILAYKESAYLEECIKSVVAQKDHADAIIFTTTPNGHILKLAEKYKLRVITGGHTTIGGDFDSAIEAGRNNSECKLVTIAHQDDIYDDGYSCAVQKAFKKSKKEALIVFTDYYEIKDKGKEYSNANLRIKRVLLWWLRFSKLQGTRFSKRMALRFGDSISCPAVTVNVEKVKTPLFRSDLRCDVDWHAWEKLSRKKGKFVFVPQKLMGHRIHEESETTKTIEDDRRTLEDYEILCRFWPKSIAKLIARIYKKSEKNNSSVLQEENTNKVPAIKRLLKTKSFYFWIALMILNYVLCWPVFTENEKSIFNMVFFSIAIVGLACLWYCSKTKIRAEKVFLACAVPLGVLFILFMPCGESPDDVTHFYRIYGISEGVIEVPNEGENAEGSYFPVDSFSSFSTVPSEGNYEKAKTKILEKAKSETEFVEYRGSASYNPIAYIPQVIGVLIGKIFGSVLLEAYLARLANFCVFLVFVYFAIKIIPKYKAFLLFLSLLPITIQEATSLSIDALTISLSFLLVSTAFYHISKKRTEMTKKEKIGLYVLALLIGISKIVYLPFLLLYVCIPKVRFGGKKKKVVHAFIMMIAVMVLNLTLLYISRRHAAVELKDVDSGGQIAAMLRDPSLFFKAVAKTLCYLLPFYIQSGLGIYLGPFAIKLPKIYSVLITLFALLILVDGSEKIFRKWLDWIFALTAFLVPIIGIFLALFISWTPVGYLVISGVQGRYFIPVLLLLPALLGNFRKNKNNKGKISLQITASMMVGMNTCAIIYIFANNL